MNFKCWTLCFREFDNVLKIAEDYIHLVKIAQRSSILKLVLIRQIEQV